jgi:2-hydroxychromene-2-carboxylate isomerase
MTTAVEFYFDFSSPYAYFAANKIDEIAEGFDRSVDWRPMLIGAAMKLTGGQPIVNDPMKAAYAKNDWERLARFQDLPWSMPENFPIAPLVAARAFYWLKSTDEELAKTFAKRCLLAYFGEGKDLANPEVVGEIATSLGIDKDEMVSAIADPTVKQILKDETQNAIDKGVFGSPFFIVDGEAFWGADRLWMVKRWLRSGGW